MTKTKFLFASLLLGAAFSMSAEAKLYKWKDDKGITHYGEVIPPEYADANRKQFDDKGREIKKKPDEDSNASRADQKAALEQRRRDNALLNTYSNEKEIDLARDRNLQQVEARINGIHMLQQSAQESLDGFHKEARAIAAGKPMPESLKADIKGAEEKIVKLRQDLEVANEKAASVRAAFEADKQRYRELTGTQQ